jgi:hypothetical protein
VFFHFLQFSSTLLLENLGVIRQTKVDSLV